MQFQRYAGHDDGGHAKLGRASVVWWTSRRRQKAVNSRCLFVVFDAPTTFFVVSE